MLLVLPELEELQKTDWFEGFASLVLTALFLFLLFHFLLSRHKGAGQGGRSTASCCRRSHGGGHSGGVGLCYRTAEEQACRKGPSLGSPGMGYKNTGWEKTIYVE